ncbi:MAG: nicotinamide mononucleotide transporter [Clostridia bacterium]|nr:nicotinamide mononucleotide transporter [Clostridia bacterium]
MKLLKGIKRSLCSLNAFEKALWISSTIIVLLTFLWGSDRDYIVLCATLVGVSALIFTAKGNVLGQALVIIFSLLYAIVSFKQAYYGEMISYIFMSGGIATMSLISWIKHPFSDGTVKVGHPSAKVLSLVGVLTIVVTVAFYFILDVLGTASLLFSTVSITTSFLASSLVLLRSPYYAIAYTLNDIILIVLWSIASANDPSAIPMIVCFLVFLVNDIYGFISWIKREKSQKEALKEPRSS